MTQGPFTLEELRLELQHTLRAELQSFRGVILEDMQNRMDQAGSLLQGSDGACFMKQDQSCEISPSVRRRLEHQHTISTSHASCSPCHEVLPQPKVKLQAVVQHGMMSQADPEERMLQLRPMQERGSSREMGKAEPERKSHHRKSKRLHPHSYEPVTPCEKISHWASFMIAHRFFDYASATIVILNAAWIGHQTDYVARNWNVTKPAYFDSGDGLFCILAVIEVVIRMLAEGSDFFRGTHSAWNWFDLVLASSQVVDISITIFFPNAGHNSLLRLLRICKLVRIARIARIAAAFPELHVLISSVVDSMASLFWTLLLIGSFLFAVSIAITQVVNEHKIKQGAEHMEAHEEVILEFYGTLPQTMLSLYMVISEGIHWSELMEPLAEHISPSMKIVFVIFVAFQLFAMMNVITAIFVDNAMKIAAKEERDEVLNTLWNEISADVGDEGQVTLEVFRKHFESTSMTRFLELTGAQNEDVGTVFNLIDVSGDGALDAEEFVDSCGQLVGPARAMQAANLAAVVKLHCSEEVACLKNEMESTFQASRGSNPEEAQKEIQNQLGEILKHVQEVMSKQDKFGQSADSAAAPAGTGTAKQGGSKWW